MVNQPASRWFEPARRIPVRIELTGGMERWPRDVRVGGKATVTVLAEPGGPVGWLARATMRLRSVASYLH